jgi:hypothetical protein
MSFSSSFRPLKGPAMRPSPGRAAPSAAVISVSCLLGLGGCAAGQPVADTAEAAGPVACAEPRPQVCTMIYAPVCAEHRDGHRETHASDCNACADETVVAHRDGPCEPLANTMGTL